MLKNIYMNIQRFAAEQTVMNKITSAPGQTDGLDQLLHDYYRNWFIDNAEPYLPHDLFGQKAIIPKGEGNTIEFHRADPLPKITKDLEEGITPVGQKMTLRKDTAKLRYIGGYMTLTDRANTEAVDPTVTVATKLLGSQCGRSVDTLHRDILNNGTSVMYGADSRAARHLLVGGQASGNDYLTVDAVKRAVRFLKVRLADKIDGSYVAIIHPDVTYTLTNDPEWKAPHTYQDTTELYEGEIGKVAGVRFVESTEAKIFHAEDLSEASRNLLVASVSSNTITLSGTLTVNDATALVGRQIIFGALLLKVSAANASEHTITVVDPAANTPITPNTINTGLSALSGAVIYPGEAGAEGRDVYSTLILGSDAYGVVDLNELTSKYIFKGLGSGGTSDPLNQRATIGWKVATTCKILTEEFMVRVETCTDFESGAN